MNDHRGRLLLLPEQRRNGQSVSRVKVVHRLVEDERRGVLTQHPGQHDPLPLPAGHIGHPTGSEPLEAHPSQRGLGESKVVRLVRPAESALGVTAHHHQIGSGKVSSQQHGVLFQHGQVSGQLPGRQGLQRHAVDFYPALGRIGSGQVAQERRLSATVRADDRRDQPVAERAGHVIQHVPVPKLAAQIFNLYHDWPPNE